MNSVLKDGIRILVIICLFEQGVVEVDVVFWVFGDWYGIEGWCVLDLVLGCVVEYVEFELKCWMFMFFVSFDCSFVFVFWEGDDMDELDGLGI